MKQFIQSKIGTVILAVLLGAVVAIAAWNLGGEWWDVRSAIRDIARGADMAKARTKLETLNDRGYVLEKLEEAVSDDAYDVRGKMRILETLAGSSAGMLNEPRALRRALNSTSVTGQRAACMLLHGDPDSKTRCAEIALAWLKDEGARDRSLAAFVCRQIDVPEAQAVLLEIVRKNPDSQEKLNLFKQALLGIKDPKPPELVDRLLAMVVDPAVDADGRGTALEVLQAMKDGPRDRVLDLSVRILEDKDADTTLRQRAAMGLRGFPEDRAWQALEGVLLSEEEAQRTVQNKVLQRNCLLALAEMTPSDPAVLDRFMDRLTQLLLDRRVYHHPYWPIHVDVATALCALNVREPIVIDIMCDYLVDDDPQDTERHVRQQGWLTLWMLTGERVEGIPSPELFDRPPPPFTDRKAARPYMLTRSRWGITPAQNAAVAKAAKDLAWMQKARQIYQQGKSQIVERWRDEAKKAAAKKVVPPDPPGPKAVGPQKEDDEGPEGAGPKPEDAESKPEGTGDRKPD